MKKYDYSYARTADAVQNSFCLKDAMRRMGIPAAGGNCKTFKNAIKRHGIDTSHFNPYAAASKTRTYQASYYLENKVQIPSYKLLRKLIAEGYKVYKCDVCGVSEWCGKPITLQLHHIDGDHLNNSLENLQVLCPNCHSQTSNFRGLANRTDKPRYFCKSCGKELKTNAKTQMCQSCYNKNKTK